MLIDWFTVGAQALNFLILVWLMRHFLYQPILRAIDTREKKIAAELADAAARKAEAAKDRDDFRKKNEVFDQQRAAPLSKATDEANAERQHLLDEARKAADALSARRQETLRNDADHLNLAIARRTQLEVFAIARQTLADLATTSLEERMGAAFTRRLGEMDSKAKDAMGIALKSSVEPAVVRSACDLPAVERAKIQNAINETFSVDARLRFETAPDLVSGVELTASGQKLAWSIGEYLKSLEKGVSEIIHQQDKPTPKAVAQPEPRAEPKPEATTPAKPTPDVKSEPKPETASAQKPEVNAKAAPKSAAEIKGKLTGKTEPIGGTKSDPDPTAQPNTEAGGQASSTPKIESGPKPTAELTTRPKTPPLEKTQATAPAGS